MKTLEVAGRGTGMAEGGGRGEGKGRGEHEGMDWPRWGKTDRENKKRDISIRERSWC